MAPPAQLARDCISTKDFAGPEASWHGGDRISPSVCPGSMAQLPSSSRRALQRPRGRSSGLPLKHQKHRAAFASHLGACWSGGFVQRSPRLPGWRGPHTQQTHARSVHGADVAVSQTCKAASETHVLCARQTCTSPAGTGQCTCLPTNASVQQARAHSRSGTRAVLPCIPQSRSLLPAHAGRHAGLWGCVPSERCRFPQKGAGDGN